MIYKQLLGDEFLKLHPKLQERYGLQEHFYGEGTMAVIISGPKLLQPMYHLFTRNDFLFPEGGQQIPFTIANHCLNRNTGEQAIYWERTFHFPQATRKFNATMTIDQRRGIVKDYLGDPAIFYSDLQFRVTNDGHLLIQSKAQRLVLGKYEMKLPKQFMGRVVALEGYDELNECYTIHVTIHNDLIGRMMAYAGTFTASNS